MKKIFAASAGLAILAAAGIANAQTTSTPGAGSPGQDQRGDTGEGPGAVKTPGTPPVADAPPSTEGRAPTGVVREPMGSGSTGSGSMTMPPAAGSDNVPAGTDRDPRGQPTTGR